MSIENTHTLAIGDGVHHCPACHVELELTVRTWRADPRRTLLVGIGMGLIPAVVLVVTILLVWGGCGG